MTLVNALLLAGTEDWEAYGNAPVGTTRRTGPSPSGTHSRGTSRTRAVSSSTPLTSEPHSRLLRSTRVPIDLAVTDLPHAHHQDRAFSSALRLLPTGTTTKVIHMSTTTERTPEASSDISRSNLLQPFDRESLLQAVRTALPSGDPIDAQAEHGDQAVFWGAFRTSGSNVSLSAR